jgi:hypothetical protein
MERALIISPYEIVGGPLCMASDDGQKVYQRIAAALKARQPVTVSFRHVTGLTPTFLHAAIGQLDRRGSLVAPSACMVETLR